MAECAADSCPVPVKKIGVQDHFGEVGTLSYLQEKYLFHIYKIACCFFCRRNGETPDKIGGFLGYIFFVAF